MMRCVMSFLVLLSCLWLNGCASVPLRPPMALPETTPFDAHPMTRQVYLDGYRDGYRSVTDGGFGSTDSLHGPQQHVKLLGWRAGAAEARRQQSKTP